MSDTATEPTTGAMKASRSVLFRILPFVPVDEIGRCARIIDAETHLPELIVSLGNMMSLVRLKYGNLHPDVNQIYAQAEAALAATTERTTENQ